MLRRMLAGWVDALVDRLGGNGVEHRRMHGIPVSVRPSSAEADPRVPLATLGAAMDLVALYKPEWIRRMRRMGLRIDVLSTPGTRAKLIDATTAVLDEYFVTRFLPSQVAASVVHEATHAMVRARGLAPTRATLPKEERMCRRSEIRLGEAMRAAGVQGADAVLERARAALAMSDEDVAPVVDWRELNAAREIARIGGLSIPLAAKREMARRAGLLDTAAGRDAFRE